MLNKRRAIGKKLKLHNSCDNLSSYLNYLTCFKEIKKEIKRQEK